MQAYAYNRSNLATVVVLALSSDARLADMPGNAMVPRRDSGLPADSVINVTRLAAIDKSWLDERVGRVSDVIMEEVAHGLVTVLGLG